MAEARTMWCFNMMPHEAHLYPGVIEGKGGLLQCNGVTATMVSPAPEVPEETDRG